MVALTAVSLVAVPRSELVSFQYASLGGYGLGLALIYAYVQTGLAEELFFRGFLTKRLTDGFGFTRANLIQAAAFGLLHGLLFLAFVDLSYVVVIALLTAGLGWVMAQINERHANGSIVPSWLIHGTLNYIAVLVALTQV